MDQNLIERAVQALRSGQLVAFPTETVYGLGADAGNVDALKKLYAAKGRPADHPVIVHLSSVDMLDRWASSVPDKALALARTFWPGPLTLILPKAASVLPQVTGGQDSVGLRVPRHRLALELLSAFGSGVAAPSANRFGQLSPTTADDVRHDFAADVELVLDGGPCEVGVESTIVDFSHGRPRILRPGMILAEHIESIIGSVDAVADVKHEQTRAPGGLPAHYAPRTPLHLVESAQLKNHIERHAQDGRKVCVLSFERCSQGSPQWLMASIDATEYARYLYRNLRKLDAMQADIIVVEKPPLTNEWDAVRDRLQRASVQADNEVNHE